AASGCLDALRLVCAALYGSFILLTWNVSLRRSCGQNLPSKLSLKIPEVLNVSIFDLPFSHRGQRMAALAACLLIPAKVALAAQPVRVDLACVGKQPNGAPVALTGVRTSVAGKFANEVTFNGVFIAGFEAGQINYHGGSLLSEYSGTLRLIKGSPVAISATENVKTLEMVVRLAQSKAILGSLKCQVR
ncbi:MAG TPA: hypothetical protein VG986_11305, partial [Pseudolabrys sp.]|nr:hypothetical protein [Pseudolabrys sp.]